MNDPLGDHMGPSQNQWSYHLPDVAHQGREGLDTVLSLFSRRLSINLHFSLKYHLGRSLQGNMVNSLKDDLGNLREFFQDDVSKTTTMG